MIKDINARARFRPVEIDHIGDNHEQEVIESCLDEKVLLSDHNLHREDLDGQSRILAADGRYFFGKVARCSDDNYSFLHRNGDSHEHTLNYSDLSGLLVLKGDVPDDFPKRFRKLHENHVVNDSLRNVGNIFLFGFNNEHMQESYIVGKLVDYDLPHVTFEVPLIDEDLEQVEVSLSALTGMFVSGE